MSHTANYLVSLFLSNKRSLKKVYSLRNTHITILRYICDSIDFNYSKRKQFNTKLYQTQIAKYSRNSERTIRDGLNYLIKKRLIKRLNNNKSKYTVGEVLYKAAAIAGGIDTGNHCLKDRYRQPLPPSNLSNISKYEKSYPQAKDKSKKMASQERGHASVESQTTHYERFNGAYSDREVAHQNIQEIIRKNNLRHG